MTILDPYWNYYLDNYYGMPRWAWGVLAIFTCLLVMIVIIVLLSCISPGSNSTSKKKEDEETGMKVPSVPPPQTPSPTPQFARDKPLPPPVPSETSEIPELK
jgi:hypothetical protein